MDLSRSQGRSAPSGDAPASHHKEATGLRGLIRRTSAFFARRHLAFGIVFGALAVTDLVVTVSCPSTYRATATVLVETARLPEDVKPLVPSVQGRLASLTGLTLSDQELARLAVLCPRLAKPRILHVFEGGASSPIQTIRDRVAVETPGRGDRSELVVISVTGENAEQTAIVASTLACRLVELDRDFRLAAASAIHSSVVSEATMDVGPLQETRARIEKLAAENPLVATTSDTVIRAQLEQERRALEEDQVAQAELSASLPLLEGEVSRWSLAVQEEAEVARRAAQAAESARGSSATPAENDPRRERLSELERQLVAARSHYTEQNPEVKRLLREISLERERLGVEGEPGEEEGPAPEKPTSPGGTGGGARLFPPAIAGGAEVRPAADAPADPPRAAGGARFLLEAPSYRNYREAIAKLEGARAHDGGLKAKIKHRLEEVARLQGLVDRLPERRLELARLEAERDRLAARFTSSQQRLAGVEKAFLLEVCERPDGARTERLALAGPVLVPDFALGPDRPWVFLVGLALSFAIAAIAAYVRDVQDRSLHTDDEVRDALDLPVLGVIPRLRGWR